MPSHNRLDCWEYQGCGRGPGGRRTNQDGECPAASASSLDGVNGGRDGGRACWIVTGTRCGGKRSGPFEDKIHECRKCSFYARVQVEEVLGMPDDETLIKRYCNK
ncbi:MAG: hypothetical protein RBS78_03175 [Coriobacteriia bacterium]|nr:hypothetical protein [Coriobacteriia bacterium]